MKNNRIFEIDFLRVIAICLMIIFHLVYDLNEFAGIQINYEAPLWYYIGKASAITFIFVAGISSGFSRKPYIRGFKVLAFGMIITIITYFFDKSQYIRFGILHFLGVSMILFSVLNRFKKWQLIILSIICLAMGTISANSIVSTFLLIPFGFMYSGFNSMDYYPIFPYLSVFILGILAFKIYYYKGKSLFNLNYSTKFIKFVSSNSLIIYLIHQPVFLLIIYIINYLTTMSGGHGGR